MSRRADDFVMWTIYENPSDYPGLFVARRWRIASDGSLHCLDPALVERTLQPIRDEMHRLGLYRLARSEGDDPVIVESWI